MKGMKKQQGRNKSRKKAYKDSSNQSRGPGTNQRSSRSWMYVVVAILAAATTMPIAAGTGGGWGACESNRYRMFGGAATFSGDVIPPWGSSLAN